MVGGEHLIGEDEAGHRFNNGEDAGEYGGVVAPFYGDVCWLTGGGDGLLWYGDGGDRFEGCSEIDLASCGDTAQDAARVVGGHLDHSLLRGEGVIGL